MTKKYFNKDDVEQLLRRVEGESIPINFIDHIIIFYANGDIKQVDSEKIKYYFPNLTHTTMNMIHKHENILEVNVKIDIEKVESYINSLATDIESLYKKYTKEAIKERKREERGRSRRKDDKK